MTWIAGSLLAALLALTGFIYTDMNSRISRLEAVADARNERIAAIDTSLANIRELASTATSGYSRLAVVETKVEQIERELGRR